MTVKNLIGQKFNKLTVIERAPDEIQPSGRKIIKWLCECDCGLIITTRGASLKNGHTKSCGNKHRSYKDMSNLKFGKLYVLKQAEDYVMSDGKRHIQWLCQCDCGSKPVVVRGSYLRDGNTRSCGCAHRDGAMGIGLIDITGNQYGRWTVLYENGRKKEPRGRIVPLWRCMCKCGVQKDLTAGTLKSGNSLSCGCYKLDNLKKRASQGFVQSKAERIVHNYLQLQHYTFSPQHFYIDLRSKAGYLLSYDFIVFNDKNEAILLIECQGVQHYKPIEYFGGDAQFVVQQENDNLKRAYAENHKIPLLEIPYYIKEQNDIEFTVKNMLDI